MTKIDRIDIRILDELQCDARISLVDIAAKVSLTPTPCARRIHNLEQAGLISAYVGLLDQTSAGLPVNAFVELRLVREREDEISSFETEIKKYPEIMECYALSGGYDYLLRVVAPNLETYHKFLREKLLSIQSVDSVQTSFALDRVIYRTSLPLQYLKADG
ncbi:MAG: Lrp/AsnC family transcriptional regulator [Pseudomonadales bacterium]|jgi:Lrp/AsnC family leucine-responsive transcriptional regulator|nr:Lrp/AsnC family transcriptional regulator [Pseudomonadales bacterium]MDP7359779.1 Lrp/AsnC family transcriptional regulator [Pseudomonadales bacterium]MDP7597007.1 Lrp/AsnC family transcriptional regulator [Pseudomonadales bacterium]HJN52210.1 Lrp/AsnC family transcriptional regulator [Pseudomonadales bacterium]|tara:strand:+ start:1981 stop:2463 length:483 start_codon:yes stop_codon:yes gene_type:complete